MGERLFVSIFFPPALLLFVMAAPCGVTLLLDGLGELSNMIRVFLVLWGVLTPAVFFTFNG